MKKLDQKDGHGDFTKSPIGPGRVELPSGQCECPVIAVTPRAYTPGKHPRSLKNGITKQPKAIYVADKGDLLIYENALLGRMKSTPQIGFFLIAFFLFAGSAFALDIQAPERVPGFSPFTFRAVLPATNMFTQAAVQFDGINIATIYPTGACQIQPDWIPFLIHCATFDADSQSNEGLTAVITHTGFANGTHTIIVSTQGPQSETKTVNVHVFDALDAQIKTEIDTQLAAVQTDMNTLQTQTTTNTEDV